MNYEHTIEIKLPRKRVIELFDDPNNLAMWQPGFISFKHHSGELGKPGSKSIIKYKMGKREMEMVETLHVRNLPHELHGSYEMKGTLNKIYNYFEEKDENTTIYRCVNEFEFSGFMMKAMGLLMPGMFKKQSLKYLNLFKEFAETGKKVV